MSCMSELAAELKFNQVPYEGQDPNCCTLWRDGVCSTHYPAKGVASNDHPPRITLSPR
jgi:hypothetical protein